jgi:phosphate:Na+ symporter
LINITGFIWAVILLTLFPVLDLLNYMAFEWFNFDSVYSTTGAPIGIALFHTLLNVINALLLVWFIPQLVSLATNNIKSRGKSDELFQLEQINTGMMATPEVSIFEAQKEIIKFGDITLKMNGIVKSLITEQDPKKINKLINKIQNYEELTDKIEADVAEFLTKTSQRDMSEASSVRIRGMLRIVANLERVGDIYFQMCKTIERKNKNKIWFTPEQRNNVLEMFNLVDKALVAMCDNLNSNYDDVSTKAAKELEDSINTFRTSLRKKHFENVEKGEYNFKSATAYSELYNSLEKVGDHIINVTEGIVGIH